MAENGVNVEVNFARALRDITARIQATPAQLTKASERAMKKTIRWLSGRVAKELGQQLGVPQKVLKKRLLVRTAGKGSDQVHILWLGARPLAAENAGKARQSRKGVTVGKRQFEGAFYRAVYNADPNVWIRARRNQGYTTLTQKPRKPSGQKLAPEYAGRFPVQRLGVEIETVAAEIFRRLNRRAIDRFNTLIEQELNFAVNHEKAK
ncbi:hypothetical protein [Enterovibrio norvegicus]|uniref:hypothetical protein n=1 Tax=Enterovibrio norvegicus TaxID=188144 RepID=UPI000C820ECC|nr:hypothetical protein [Enterovibrio norvegicus]PMN73159.1 hypothetical protein BCT27_12505 [Enterovibrio norvegicus]